MKFALYTFTPYALSSPPSSPPFPPFSHSRFKPTTFGSNNGDKIWERDATKIAPRHWCYAWERERFGNEGGGKVWEQEDQSTWWRYRTQLQNEQADGKMPAYSCTHKFRYQKSINQRQDKEKSCDLGEVSMHTFAWFFKPSSCFQKPLDRLDETKSPKTILISLRA